MDKNAIKKYAVWARRELISRVSQRAALYEITDKGYGDASADSVLGRVMSAEEKRQRQALIAQIREKGFEQVMEEIAYTWFNRFIALRFMEVNGYLPTRIRVFTDDENNFKPQILTEAINMELDGLDMEKVYTLKNANDDDALFKYMIIVQCNALSSILPGMFQRISDYTELLFPDNLLREGSVLDQMISMISEEDWSDQVQIIGWLYQYYNTEPKAKVFGRSSSLKITKFEIPAATQLFTPDWIVHYMVENSLGRLWLEGHPNDDLKSEWKYYLDEAAQTSEVQAQLDNLRKEYATLRPEEIRVIDPCMGSGHILCVLFDVLVRIYEDYGYTAREAVIKIVEHNLWGLDIDDRAAQLSYFSVMMKARQYDRRFLTRSIQPHVYAIFETNTLRDNYIHARREFGLPENQLKTLDYLVDAFVDAKEYGSILQIAKENYSELRKAWDNEEEKAGKDHTMSIWYSAVSPLIPKLIEQATVLSQTYHVVVTNPPYMSMSNADDKLNEFVRSHYPAAKVDLCSVFINRNIQWLAPHGYIGMITMQGWMFLTTFESLRDEVIKNGMLVSEIHMDSGAFDNDVGSVVKTVSFIIGNKKIANYTSCVADLKAGGSSAEKEAIFLSRKTVLNFQQDTFNELPGHVFAYWVSRRAAHNYKTMKVLAEIGQTRQGMKTGDNDRFLRFWYEVDISRISFVGKSDNYRWFPCNKGGDYKKWFGNNSYVVNWANDGYEIRNFKNSSGKLMSRPQNIQFNFHEGLTWSSISSGMIAMRYSSPMMMFESKGSMCFVHDARNLRQVQAYLNSKVGNFYVSALSPNYDYTEGAVEKVPIKLVESQEIDSLADLNIALAKEDWDSFETSWDFKEHPFITSARWAARSGEAITIKQAFEDWKGVAEGRFRKLKENEEELNRIFIDIYGLNEELTPEVEDKDVTVRRADLQREVRSFISYSVGCMFGRYTLGAPGLIYAGGEWDVTKYPRFQPDKDAIIPICDDEYFEDDIVGRFVSFVEKAFGKEVLEENLRFIADTLGGKGSSRDVIRAYFINDFYADHIKVYQKRPIYWLFDSGKKNGFKCLIYMHRYQPDTIARIRTDYVHEQQSRYRTAIEDLESRIANAGTSERVKLSKQLTKLQEQAEELRVYEEKIHHLADQMIRIDLDDGVKHNYAIFQDVLAKIK